MLIVEYPNMIEIHLRRRSAAISDTDLGLSLRYVASNSPRIEDSCELPGNFILGRNSALVKPSRRCSRRYHTPPEQVSAVYQNCRRTIASPDITHRKVSNINGHEVGGHTVGCEYGHQIPEHCR